MADHGGETITQQLHDDWAEIRRVMTLAEGAEWDESLPQEVELVQRPALGGDGVVCLYKFPDVIYALEPSRRVVVEQRPMPNGLRVRQYGPAGELLDELLEPLSDPRLN
jgi:hypothetical protein